MAEPRIITTTEFSIGMPDDDTRTITKVTTNQYTDSAGRRQYSKDTSTREELGTFTKPQIRALLSALVNEVGYTYVFGDE